MNNQATAICVNDIDAATLKRSTFVKQLLPWIVAVAYFMEALDTTILNTAVPSIATALEVSPLSMKAALAIYTLSLAVFIPISGWMADRFGTRRVFSTAIGLFTLASLMCGLSNDYYLLILCRGLQGCAGAMMIPVGRLTLVRSFDNSEIVRILSFVTISGWIGPVVGPVIGGFIVTNLGWPYIFFVNIPIGLLGLVFVRRYLPDYRENDVKPLDFIGFLLFGAGIALLSYDLEIFGDHVLSQGAKLGLLALSMALITAYGIHSIRVPFPLLRLSLFRIRTFSVSVGGSFLTRLGVGGVPFLLPLLYQVSLGFSPVLSGLLILPQALAGILAKLALPRILDKLGYRNMLILNTIALASLMMLYSLVEPGTPIWPLVLLASLYGACTSLQYTTMNTMAYAEVGDEKSSAGSIASTAQELSISFGVAAAGITTAFFVPNHFVSGGGLICEGLQHTFLVLGCFTLLSTLVFLRLRANDGELVTRQRRAPIAGVRGTR